MASWRVLRQDDNGNVYVVAEELEEAAAREQAAQLEAHGHKQLYSVERVVEATPPPRDRGPRGRRTG